MDSERNFISPYFTGWDIGKWTGDGDFITGASFNEFISWPLYASEEGLKNCRMWSGWQILDPDYGYTTHWLEEKQDDDELFGKINFDWRYYMVIGVYDPSYHNTKEARPSIENYITGDPLASSFVIIREYGIKEFDEYRYKLGLISEEQKN